MADGVVSSEALFRYDRGRGRVICGVDETGRACWAGPLTAAAVRFDYDRLDGDAFARLQHLNSSKRIRSTSRRAALLLALLELADMISFVVIPAGQIDREGLDQCNMLALGRALDAVKVDGSINLLDGQQRKGCVPSGEWIVRGDETSAAIAAASIVAKVMRDEVMQRLDEVHSGYGFAVHKGYGTRGHEAALIDRRAVSSAHRRYAVRKVCRRLGIPLPADNDARA